LLWDRRRSGNDRLRPTPDAGLAYGGLWARRHTTAGCRGGRDLLRRDATGGFGGWQTIQSLRRRARPGLRSSVANSAGRGICIDVGRSSLAPLAPQVIAATSRSALSLSSAKDIGARIRRCMLMQRSVLAFPPQPVSLLDPRMFGSPDVHQDFASTRSLDPLYPELSLKHLYSSRDPRARRCLKIWRPTRVRAVSNRGRARPSGVRQPSRCAVKPSLLAGRHQQVGAPRDNLLGVHQSPGQVKTDPCSKSPLPSF